MYGFIIVLSIIICILLVLIVLVQNPKGGGLASSFSASNQFMGVKRTADFVEKATWGLATALFIFCILAPMLPRKGDDVRQSKIQEQLENSAIDPGRMPSYPTAPAGEPSDNQEEQQNPQE